MNILTIQLLSISILFATVSADMLLLVQDITLGQGITVGAGVHGST